MEVEYELTRDDLFAFQWRAAFSSRIGKRTRRWAYLGWFVAIVLLAIVPAIGADGFVISRISWKFILVAYPIVALGQWFFETRLTRRLILRLLKDEKSGRGQLGRHRLAMNDEGVVESTAVNQSRTSWTGVDRVEQNADYIFIYTAPHAAHMIPKRAFGDPKQAEAFYQFARTRKAAAP
jgi:hypothetical protein